MVTNGMSQSSAQCGHLMIGLGIGLAFLSFGLAIRLGYAKRYFLVRGPAPFFGPANYHFVILIGVLSLILGLIALPGDVQTRQDLLGYVFIPSIILAFIVGLWQPWWLKPKWIRQLKENHPDIYPFLREAAQEEVGNDRKKAEEWASKMDTLESQNEWVAEVRKRLGMPDPRTTKGGEKE
jgi:vacuolar-type H+-ATPase subunit I/STV1